MTMRHASGIRGRIVMVRHEYPFATGHVHRRVKLALALEMGAAGFLIAHPEAGVGPVSGSSGRNGGDGIPALGIGAETADALRRSPDGALSTARMVIDGDDHPARTCMLIADLPGRGLDWVVVSAHIDGHPHGESAMDNATGVAVALGLARLLAPHVSGCPRGLRICLFSAEEWGLIGSRLWLERMDEAARRLMVINVNLDSVGGASGLTALTSGFERLDTWVRHTAAHSISARAGHSPEPGSSARAALASEASGQRGHSISARAGHSPEPGSSARAALASEASGQRGHSISARAGHSPEPGSSARAALASEASGQ